MQSEAMALCKAAIYDVISCYSWCHIYKSVQYSSPWINIDGLAQDCSNSSALAMELLQSCAEPFIYTSYLLKYELLIKECVKKIKTFASTTTYLRFGAMRIESKVQNWMCISYNQMNWSAFIHITQKDAILFNGI